MIYVRYIEDINFNHGNKESLDLSYSNLKVDFSKTYQAKNGRVVEVSNVDFSHIDLSDSKLEVLGKTNTPIVFRDCRLAFTALKLSNFEEITFYSCNLNNNDFSNLLGIELDKTTVIDIFKALSFNVTDKGLNLEVTVPSRRTDISIKEDLIEEIARINGYDKITPTLPAKNETPFISKDEKLIKIEKFCFCCRSRSH